MAEQDRKDLVPSVLNDLIDVDGDATDGDGLTYSGGAWRPAPGLLPPNGSLLNVWDGTLSTGLTPNASVGINVDPTDQTAVGYVGTAPADLAAPLPRLGHWINDGGVRKFVIDYPGVYDIELYWSITITNTADDSRLSIRPGFYGNYNNSRSAFVSPYPTGVAGTQQISGVVYAPVWATPDLVDASWALAPSFYWQRPSGAVTISSAYFEYTVWQRSAGISPGPA